VNEKVLETSESSRSVDRRREWSTSGWLPRRTRQHRCRPTDNYTLCMLRCAVVPTERKTISLNMQRMLEIRW